MKTLHFIALLLVCVTNVLGQKQQKDVIVDLHYNIVPGSSTSRVKIVCLLPQTIAGRQEVMGTSFSVPPSRVFSENGNRYAEFEFVNPKEQQEITVSSTMRLYQYDLKTAGKAAAGVLSVLPADSLTRFLQDEKFIETGHSSILAQAAKLQAAATEKTIQNIYAFVTRQLRYEGHLFDAKGAAKALQARSGDCTEFADLFVALCRASQIPARVVDGYVTEWSNTAKHSWVEVYTPSLGWVPFDPTPGNGAYYSNMDNRYVYLSTVRNDKTLNNFQFFTFTYWGTPTRVSGTVRVRNAGEAAALARVSEL